MTTDVDDLPDEWRGDSATPPDPPSLEDVRVSASGGGVVTVRRAGSSTAWFQYCGPVDADDVGPGTR